MQSPRRDSAAGYISFASAQDLQDATRYLAELALRAGNLPLVARILGERVIDLVGGGVAKSTAEGDLRPWHYELRRYFQPWSPEKDQVRSTVRVNLEDVKSLVVIIGSKHQP